jgi:membrane-associated protease RseP (regulator of RpoE activity)
MMRVIIRSIVLTAVLGLAAVLGSPRTASACHPLMHHYGIHGILLPGGGFLIQNVVPGSEAAFDGLLPGDVILEVERVRVFELIHIHGPFAIAFNGPGVAFMLVQRGWQTFVVAAF